MSKMIKAQISFACLLTLAGCSTYSETFDCPPGLGVGCKSISDVDRMIDEGKLADEKPSVDERDHGLPIDLAGYKPTSLSTLQGTAEDAVSRRPERYLRVWIAAFEDGKGDLFSESFVYTVFKRGEWRIDKQVGS